MPPSPAICCANRPTDNAYASDVLYCLMTKKLSVMSQAGPFAPAGMYRIASAVFGSGLPEAARKPCACQSRNGLRSDAKSNELEMITSTPQGKPGSQPAFCMKLPIEASTSLFEVQMSAGREPS